MSDDFQFIKETRKEKPINRRRLARQIIKTALLAVLFGALACLTFVLLRPRLEQYFMPQEQPQVSFAVPDPEDAEPLELDSQDAESGREEGEEEAEQEKVIIEKALPMTLQDYQTLQNKLYAVGRRADKFIVSVTNVKSNTDIFNTAYESQDIGAGEVIADTGDYLLILTEKKAVQGASSIRVTFADGSMADAKLQKYDGNTGLAVLRVSERDLSEETLDQIQVAKFGNSAAVVQGQMVLAVGSPIGTIHSILSGNITSYKNSISTMDRNYTVFTTDMAGSPDAGGVLINMDGEIIGFILQDFNMQKEQAMIAAVSISELVGVIELLSNDKPVPYLGMRVSTVTDDIAIDYNMPKGVYVREVAPDSPAMAAGFQSGDVITAVNGEDIFSAESYGDILYGLHPDDTVEFTCERQGADEYSELLIEAEVGVLE